MKKLLKRIAIALDNLVMQARRRNDMAEAFYREALGVLTQAKNPSGSLRSEQPAAAPGCRVCGNPATPAGEVCVYGPLTQRQWLAHHEDFRATAKATWKNVKPGKYADQSMLQYGSPKEES